MYLVSSEWSNEYHKNNANFGTIIYIHTIWTSLHYLNIYRATKKLARAQKLPLYFLRGFKCTISKVRYDNIFVLYQDSHYLRSYYVIIYCIACFRICLMASQTNQTISMWFKILLRSLCESRQLWCLSQIGLLTKKCLYWDSNTFRINVYGNDAKWHLTTPQGCKKRKIEMGLMCVVCTCMGILYIPYILTVWLKIRK